MTNRIHIQRWDGETNKMVCDDYSTKDVDFLMEKGIIDNDQLGYAMDDCKAFNEAMEYCCEVLGSFTYDDLTREYLKRTNRDIWIV